MKTDLRFSGYGRRGVSIWDVLGVLAIFYAIGGVISLLANR